MAGFCDYCHSAGHATGSHGVFERMFTDESCLLEGHSPWSVHCQGATLDVEPHALAVQGYNGPRTVGVVRRWDLPEGRKVVGVFFEMGEREE